ncbi:hypothetical protein B6U90_01035 [Thermoplasmatales archaeon ex4484_6]|nr:MAG: hypothetical protein B6U90_01035 [Thermoplasmatales archaeon ex4484_6]RLF68596.1 MAG: hypothetical protein DRN57_03500 [Thermoplasmata archaeon]
MEGPRDIEPTIVSRIIPPPEPTRYPYGGDRLKRVSARCTNTSSRGDPFIAAKLNLRERSAGGFGFP